MRYIKKTAVSVLSIALILCALAGFDFKPRGRSADAANLQTVNITVHYYRYAGDYTDWNLWMWTADATGSAYAFDASRDGDGFAVKTFSVPSVDLDLTEGQNEKAGIGFIVRRGDWAERDTGSAADRYVSPGKIQNNAAEVWLVQNDANIYYRREDADISPKILNATFTSAKVVRVTLTNAVTEANKTDFKLYAGSAEVTNASLSASVGATTVTFTLAANADFLKEYEVRSVYYGNAYVNLNGVYGTDDFNNAYKYDGELGAVYSKASTVFRLWSPTASAVKLKLYDAGSGGTAYDTKDLTRADKGVWSVTVNGDLDKKYYTYTVTVNGVESPEITDPYARAAGVNGRRGMVVDLSATNPDGWAGHTVAPLDKYTDAVIYETHIREFSIDPSSGVSAANRGKYLAFTETDTKNADGLSTGVAHLKELGITELHILPMFDYSSVDESRLGDAQFNWGYDPENYNLPEGSYSTDPAHGEVRIKEMKQMIMSLHKAGIRVIMDVVYNHTSKSADSNLNLAVPGYYYRMDSSGAFSNGSGTGNETASERGMVRKFIIDSVTYWAKEYKLDGFRFDLMALHDIDTMNAVKQELRKINDKILVYGEGWTGGTSPLATSRQSLKANAKKLDGIAVFSDDIRDAVKGSVFNGADKGFVQGKTGMEDAIKFGVTGATAHHQVSGKTAWAANPAQTVNYVSAHDNWTLWDKLSLSAAGESEADRIKMNKLAAAITFTSQGIPFFTAGEEMLRSKPNPEKDDGVDENSYKSPDSVNAIRWDDKKGEKLAAFEYYKGLIALRKKFDLFRFATAEQVQDNIEFLTGLPAGVVGYTARNEKDGVRREAFVYYNANKTAAKVTLPAGAYSVYLDGGNASGTELRAADGGENAVAALGALVAVKETELPKSGKGGVNAGLIAGIVAGGVVVVGGAAAGAAVIIKKKRKGKADGGKG